MIFVRNYYITMLPNGFGSYKKTSLRILKISTYLNSGSSGEDRLGFQLQQVEKHLSGVVVEQGRVIRMFSSISMQ